MVIELRKIGVIGPPDMVEKVLLLSSEYPSVKFVSCPYENEKLAPKIVKEVQHKLDGILFTGPIPYHISFEYLKIRKPWGFVPYTTTGLLKAFIDFMKEHPEKLRKPISLSLDTLKENDVIDMVEEIGLTVNRVFVKEYDPTQEIFPSFVKFHVELFKDGKIDVAFSCLKSTWEELKKQGYPAFLVSPMRNSIRVAIDRLIMEMDYEERKLDVAFVLFKFRNKDDFLRKKDMIKVHDGLLDETHRWGGMVVHQDPSTLFLITSYSHIHRITDGFKVSPFQDLLDEVSGELSMIVGVGRDIGEAEKNVREAEKIVEHRDQNGVYLYDGRSLRKLEPGSRERIYTKITDERIMRISKKLGINPINLKILEENFLKVRDGFTSDEVANVLKLSPRTARRILQRLKEAGFLRMVGKKSMGKGRPKHLYIISKEEM